MGRVRAWQHDCDCAAARPQAAVVNINILCSFLQLSSGLNLSACTCWGGIHPHSLRHTPRARQDGRSDHILKYSLLQVAAMGITSRLRGSGPGGCAELEPDVGYCWHTDHLSLSKFFARSSLRPVRAERRHPGTCWHEAPAPFIYLSSTRANVR